MTPRGIGRQYANALFNVAEKHQTTGRVRQEVIDFGALIEAHEELGRVFLSPGVSMAQKTAVVDALIQAIGGLSEEVRRTLLLMAERDRLMYLAEFVSAFNDRCMEADQVVRAEFTTTAPLNATVQSTLVAALSRAVARKIEVTERVDPAIIGGVVARVGSVVFDGSVTRQIERLRQKLLADV